MRQASQGGRAVLRRCAKVLMAGLSVSLVGCGNSDISTVKKMLLVDDQTYTVGQVFDNRKACDSTKWGESTDDRGRKIVEYRCNFNGVADFGEKSVEGLKKYLLATHDGLENDYVATIARYQDSVKFNSQQVARYQAEINSPDTLQSIVQKNPQLSSTPTIELQGIVQQTLEQAKENLPGAQSDLQRDQDNLSRAIAGKGQYFAAQDKRLADKLGLLDGLAPTSACEVYQWAIPEDGDPALVYSGEEIALRNGQKRSFGYGAMTRWAIKSYITNDAKDYGDYVKAFGFANVWLNAVRGDIDK